LAEMHSVPPALTRPSSPLGWVFLLIFAATYLALYLGYSAVPDSVLREDIYFYGMAGQGHH
jgi:hypothetical protein